ncbi:MAG TPA: hypothetical protein PKI89_03580, partial [Tepidiformaceae bacterium]|nr:hypothetical protein [Tepidiformaceae bacterium]
MKTALFTGTAFVGVLGAGLVTAPFNDGADDGASSGSAPFVAAAAAPDGGELFAAAPLSEESVYADDD